MSAYRGSTGSPMNFINPCRHRWGPWEPGRTQRWRECERCGQVDGRDLDSSKGRESYMALNGVPQKQALVHASPGFWRDGRGGESMSRPDAEKLAASRRRRRAPTGGQYPVRDYEGISSQPFTSPKPLKDGRPRRRIIYTPCDDISEATRAKVLANGGMVHGPAQDRL